jgi:hypothetical protein
MLVKLVDGGKFIDTFVDNTSRQVVFKEQGRIARDRIKKMSPYIDPGWNWITMNRAEEFDSAQAREFPEICPVRVWQEGGYVTCQKTLDKDGVCPAHKQVRFSVHHKHEPPKNEPTLRKMPPKRTAGGRTRPRRMYGRV